MGLADLVKAHHRAKADPLSLVPRIEKHLMKTRGAAEDRRDMKFHPSDLSKDFCPRAWAIYQHHPNGLQWKESGISPQLSRIFDNGHHLHARLQRYLHEMGVLWGTWRNTKNGQTHCGTALYSAPGELDNDWEYSEVKLRHDGDTIVGSTDGIVVLGSHVVGVEIKSINTNQFRRLEDPVDAHRDQALIYLHCLDYMRTHALGSVNTLPELSGFVVLYEDKNTQALKEFWVANDPAEKDKLFAELRPRMRRALDSAYGRWPPCHCPTGKPSTLCAKLAA